MKSNKKEKFIIYTDGASRGNPGPAGAGVVFAKPGGKVLKKYDKYLGEKTNNEAEYEAAIWALNKFKALFGKKKAKKAEIELRTDSELLEKQMNGQFKIKSEELSSLFLELWNLRLDFGKVEITHIGREKNKKADLLANEALDRELGQKGLF